MNVNFLTFLNKTQFTLINPVIFSLRARFITTNSKYRKSDAQLSEVSQVTVVDLEEPSHLEREQEIESIRNKSRLKPPHRNMLLNLKPYNEDIAEHHLTVKYHRKMYGKYGSESGVNPGISWPTKSDMQERKEYEKVAYPFSIQELAQSAQNEIKERDLSVQKQQERVVANIAKLEIWKKQIRDRIKKKEAEALAAREKREKLIEEVRRHFGFTVDDRDDKFKEMLAIKEKGQRKQDKKAKMEEREKKAIDKLMNKHENKITETEKISNET